VESRREQKRKTEEKKLKLKLKKSAKVHQEQMFIFSVNYFLSFLVIAFFRFIF